MWLHPSLMSIVIGTKQWRNSLKNRCGAKHTLGGLTIAPLISCRSLVSEPSLSGFSRPLFYLQSTRLVKLKDFLDEDWPDRLFITFFSFFWLFFNYKCFCFTFILLKQNYIYVYESNNIDLIIKVYFLQIKNTLYIKMNKDMIFTFPFI